MTELSQYFRITDGIIAVMIWAALWALTKVVGRITRWWIHKRRANR